MAKGLARCVLLALALGSAQPQCHLCTNKCRPLEEHKKEGTTAPLVSVVCNDSCPTLSNYFQTGNFSLLQTLKIQSPCLKELNFTNEINATELDLSGNGLDTFDLPFYNILKLNLSCNSLHSLGGSFSQLKTLDLSHNSIEDIWEINLGFKLEELHLESNLLSSVSNFSSSTLEFLDLTSNIVESIHFGNCNELKYLNLSFNNISFIDVDTFKGLPKLEVLNISINTIKELSEGVFKTPNLLKLDLKRNFIEKLAQGCFAGLNRLQYLDISENRIIVLSPGMMQELPGLVRLILSGNKHLNGGLQDLGLVLVTRRLQYIAAAGTNQTKIPSSLTRSVRSLNLNHNNISSIQCGDLDSYPLLNTLLLAHNNISFIEDDALGRLELLSCIILDYNSLNSIPHTLPGNLKTLSLRGNLIKLSPNDFTGLSQLTTLDLSQNLISNVTESTFQQLKALTLLNMSDNPIKILTSSSFVGLAQLKTLDLSYLYEVASCDEILCFPLPQSNQLISLTLKQSPTLANRLLNDIAALKALKQLTILDMSDSNITHIREDLVTLLPHLNVLSLEGNELNCTSIQWLHIWLEVSQIANCNSSIKIKPQDNGISSTTTESIETSSPVVQSILTSERTTHETTEKYVNFKLNSTIEQEMVTEYEILTNEIWDNTSSLGMVYAFSTEIPASHPGLFILLLVPVALVSAVLILNYSRMIQARRREQIRFDSEIEIPDFSNELW